MIKRQVTCLGILLCVCLALSACGPKKTAVKPVEADWIVIAHELEDGVTDAQAVITDEETVSEIVRMHNTLQLQDTGRPMDADRLVLSIYSDDEVAAVWRISVWDDDGMVITSGEAFGLGNHVVKSDFDYDRLMEILQSFG